jgi:Xaa-Pro dipeptidase
MELSHLKHVDNVTSIKHYWEYPAEKPERWEDVLFETLGKSNKIGLASKSPFEIAEFLSSQDFTIQKCDIIEQLRWIKSKTEIELIRRAARYCDDTISILNKNAYYGMTELEVFSIGRKIQQRLIKETEFDYLASEVLVAAWPSRISHQPHGVPKVSDVLIEGSHISLAFLRVNGYAAELERTFFTAEPNKEQKEIFALMMEARSRSYQTLKAGVSGEEVDLAAKLFIEKEGLKENFVHRTGHGIGLGNHEGPYVAEGDKTILQENMVISIEPGIYIEGIGGFRHSDTVRVTKDGYEILTNCPDDLKSMTFTKSKPLQRLKGQIVKKIFGIK